MVSMEFLWVFCGFLWSFYGFLWGFVTHKNKFLKSVCISKGKCPGLLLNKKLPRSSEKRFHHFLDVSHIYRETIFERADDTSSSNM